MNTYITSENIEEIKRRLDFLANNYDVKSLLSRKSGQVGL